MLVSPPELMQLMMVMDLWSANELEAFWVLVSPGGYVGMGNARGLRGSAKFSTVHVLGRGCCNPSPVWGKKVGMACASLHCRSLAMLQDYLI